MSPTCCFSVEQPKRLLWSVCFSPHDILWFSLFWHLRLHLKFRKENRRSTRRQRREPFVSLIQVVEGDRETQCTLLDCSLWIHRSFLLPDIVHAALPWGAQQCVTSLLSLSLSLFLLVCECVAAPPADSKPSGPPAIQVCCIFFCHPLDKTQTNALHFHSGHRWMHRWRKPLPSDCVSSSPATGCLDSRWMFPVEFIVLFKVEFNVKSKPVIIRCSWKSVRHWLRINVFTSVGCRPLSWKSIFFNRCNSYSRRTFRSPALSAVSICLAVRP